MNIKARIIIYINIRNHSETFICYAIIRIEMKLIEFNYRININFSNRKLINFACTKYLLKNQT